MDLKSAIKPGMLVAVVLGFFITNLTICNNVGAQSASTKAKHRIWVNQTGVGDKYKGFLYMVKDSSIYMSPFLKNDDSALMGNNYQKIDYQQIDIIKIRRKGKVGRGMLIGSLLGFSIGSFIGLMSEDDTEGLIRFTKNEKFWISSISLGTHGMIIGAIIGSAKIKIPINGRKKRFIEEREKLRKYSFLNNE
jgi:hypothetical protein